jgi:hypothetical protein
MPERNPPLVTSWVIVTFKKPLQWSRADDEVWMFNPHVRYVLNHHQLEGLKPFIATISELKTGGNYRQLNSSTPLQGARILIERYRDRGIGDLLFLSGVLQYIYDMSGSTSIIDLYALTDRAGVLRFHPALGNSAAGDPYGPLAGPILYDSLPHYTAHWFIEQVTEYVEEPDQLNVYDQLYRQLGIDPKNVAPKYKRPYVYYSQSDWRDLDSIYATAYGTQQVDLRVTPYIVLCPAAYGSLRSAPYRMWLALAQALSDKFVVCFVGRTSDQGQLPAPDITFGEFYQEVDALTKKNPKRIFNLIGPTPLRPMMAFVARSTALVSLDSGMLYVAQAARVPAVSLWGTHAPHARLLYDGPYMRGAVWKRESCPASPCWAYAGFPTDRCPQGDNQRVCHPLATITVNDILQSLDTVLTDVNGARPPQPLIASDAVKTLT